MLLGSDTSTDPEDIRDELKAELVRLNGELKAINPDFAFSGIINPLLADAGPAVAHVRRSVATSLEAAFQHLTIERLKSIRPFLLESWRCCWGAIPPPTQKI